MNIALVLVHNKSDKDNFDQVEGLKPFLTEVVDGPFLDEITGETWTTIHHEIKDLGFPHTVKVYQVIPFGVTPPANIYHINSGGTVQYGNGDEDKTGDHPRFFNWGLKRGTDYGAEVVIHLEDFKKFDLEALKVYLNSLIDPEDKHEFIEDEAVKISTLKLLKQVGQLKEDRTKAQAILDLKQRNRDRGNKNG